MAWSGQSPVVDAVLPPGGPVTSNEPVLGGAEGISPTAKLVWDLVRWYLTQNPALTAAPMTGAAIGVPGGAARTIPRPKDVDLRKLANDYARFVMGKAEAPIPTPDPRIIRQLQGMGQRAGAPIGYDPHNLYQERVPRPDLPRVERTSTYMNHPIPVIQPDSSSSGWFPIMSLRSEAWRPPEQSPDAFNKALEALKLQGLWP